MILGTTGWEKAFARIAQLPISPVKAQTTRPAEMKALTLEMDFIVCLPATNQNGLCTAESKRRKMYNIMALVSIKKLIFHSGLRNSVQVKSRRMRSLNDHLWTTSRTHKSSHPHGCTLLYIGTL